MSRSLFGLWGARLSDDDFGQALAALGVVGAPGNNNPATIATELKTAIASSERVRFHLGIETVRLAEGHFPPAETFLDAWKNGVGPSAAQHLRLEIVQGGPNPPLDEFWLASLLSSPSVATGVYFLQDEPRVPVAWSWPLRIGVLDDPRSRAFAETLKTSHRNRLFKLINVATLRRECDVLLLPYSLRSSLELVLSRPARLAADCVVVVGAAQMGPHRTRSLVSALRTEVECAAVCVASAPGTRRSDWFDSLITELSHNLPFDTAVVAAARRHRLRAPLLIASSRFVDIARLSMFVERLGTHLGAAAEKGEQIVLNAPTAGQLRLNPITTIRDAAATLRDNAGRYDYKYETGDATSLVEFREDVERKLARPVNVAMANGGAETTPREGRDTRTVQAEFLELASSRHAAKILPAHEYILEVLIAAPQDSRITAPQGIPRLAPSAAGHELRILFTELRDGTRDPLSRSQQTDIHLPANGPSTAAHFAIRTGSSGQFLARIAVLHRTRVLQTLRLTAPIGGTQQDANLDDESIVRQGFADLENRPTYDAALILNHSDGVAGVGIATRSDYKFSEPEGLRKSVESIEALLSQMVDIPEKSLRMDKEEVLDIVRQLATHGRLIRDIIVDAAPPELGTASRIQVVETRYGSYLPIEFFYDNFAPNKRAKLCPHAMDALSGQTPSKCPHASDPSFVCPTAFWGFSRVLERRAHIESDDKDFEICEPTLQRPRLDILTRALVGWSNKVNNADVTGAHGFVTSLAGVTSVKPVTVRDWKAWEKAVDTDSPTLLILLAHSLEDPAESGFAALEIGKETLRAANLERPYVRRTDRDPGPAVLLLGCSTELTSIPFHNFVARFRAKGASLVLGTLASIRGRHAAQFVSRFTAALKKHVGQPDATFGDVLLEVKRQMLAQNDPFALTLIAYGDADWRL
jgi:hypothetical protein